MSDLNRSVKIYIDQSDALRKMQGLSAATDELRGKLQSLETTGKGSSREANTLRKSIEGNETAMKKYAAQVKDTERVLNNLSGVSRNELIKVQKQLQRELNNTTRGTQEYRDKLAMLQRVQKESALAQNEMNGSLGRNRSMMGRVADGFNRYFGMIASGLATITGLSLAFRKLAENVAHQDDVYADVMKTTNMTREEVVDLNEELKKFDTRTAREELNMLARDAGKLGMTGKKDILDFVDAGNQIRVALGEDLGEEAIKEIGKISDVFKRSTQEMEGLDLKGKMLAVGSAINELGMSSTASEPYLVNFTKRMSGVASQAGINIQSILGYASALDQSGQAVEMSATALQKFIMKLMEDPAKFAKLAGLEVQAFTDLLKNDTNQAIVQVLDSLNKKGGFQALIPIFSEMGLDGARAVGVLSSMATNIDKITEAQRIATEAFADGTSITAEYNIKNENLQAQLEKARKEFNEAAISLGERLSPALLKSTKLTTNLIKLLVGLPEFWKEHGRTMLAAAAAIATYTIAINAATIAHKAHAAAALIGTRAVKAFSIALNLIKANPLILLASAAASVIVYFSRLGVHTRELTEDQKRLKEAVEETKAVMGETRKIEEMARSLKNLNKTQTESLRDNAQMQYDILREKEAAFLAAHKAEYQRKIAEIQQANITDAKKAFFITQEKRRMEELIESEIGLSDKQLQAEKTKLLNIIRLSNERISVIDLEDERKVRSAELQAELTEKQQRELEEYKKTIEEIRRSNMTETELENLDYEQRLKDARLFGVKKEQMTREQLEIFEILTSQHLKKLSNIEQKQKQDAWRTLQDEFKKASEEEDLAAHERFIASNEALEAALLANEITESEFLERRLAIAEQFELDKQLNALSAMEAELALRRQYGEDTIALEQAIADARIRLIQAHNNKIKKANDEKEAADKKAEKEAKKGFVAWKDMKEEEQLIAIETAAKEAAAAVEGARTIGEAAKATLNVIREKIKAYLMEAVAVQIAKVITKVPFPANIVVAAAAAAAVSMLFDKMWPEAKMSSATTNQNYTPNNKMDRGGGVAYATGGYTGDGRMLEPAGIVHRGEYVVPSFVMREPAALNHLKVLESLRQSRLPQISMPGYAAGGMVAPSSSASNDETNNALIVSTLRDLDTTIQELSVRMDNIRAWVSYQDFAKADETIKQIRNDASFSRK